MPSDLLGRSLRDLRISVTDRCNMRCSYCMPKEFFGPDYAFLERKELLTYEEITRVTQVFVRLGVRKVRITGGEPLLRRELSGLVSRLASVKGIDDLTLTTNGLLLKRHARALKAAGLHRVTVSLDSLDQQEFASITSVEAPIEEVLSGIREAQRVGLTPVKVNAVIRRGMNENAILGLATFFRGRGCVLRFIEYMDVGNTNDWRPLDVVPAREVLELIGSHYPLQPLSPNYTGEVARRWGYRDGQGEIGVVSSISEPFCGDCTRARLSPEGELYTCLFAPVGHDLRTPLRQGATDREMLQLVSGIWQQRKDRYSELRSTLPAGGSKVEMSRIGG